VLKVLLRSLSDVRSQLTNAVQTLPRPLMVSQEGYETGGDIPYRQPYRYLLEKGAKVSMLVVRDDPRGGMWRDPVGDLADRTFTHRRDANAAASGYLLFFDKEQPAYLRRDIWDRQVDIEALIVRLDLRIPLPRRVKEPVPGKKRRARATAPTGQDDPEPTHREPRKHRTGPRKPAPPPSHHARNTEESEVPSFEEDTPPPPAREPDPFALLGLADDVTEAEVVKAFRALIVQYHPDKVAHLAPEFRALAESRTRELTDAYDRARRQARER
jgi:hypothetical protein